MPVMHRPAALSGYAQRRARRMKCDDQLQVERRRQAAPVRCSAASLSRSRDSQYARLEPARPMLWRTSGSARVVRNYMVFQRDARRDDYLADVG